MKEANNEKKRNRRRGYRLKKKLVLGVSTKKPPRMVKRTFCYRPDYMPELEVFRSLPHLSSFRWEKKFVVVSAILDIFIRDKIWTGKAFNRKIVVNVNHLIAGYVTNLLPFFRVSDQRQRIGRGRRGR